MAARRFHDASLIRVVRSPLSFFDTTPLGRILNRFSKDQDSVDTLLPDAVRSFALTLANTNATFLLISLITPAFLVPLIPLLILYYYVQKLYRATSRELKRLDALSRSPLYAQFAETLTGLPTIRASGATDRFISVNQNLIDLNNRPLFLQLCIQRWLGLRLEMIGNVLILAASLLCVWMGVSPAMTGLSISYALSVTGVLNWTVRQAAEMEIQMNEA